MHNLIVPALAVLSAAVEGVLFVLVTREQLSIMAGLAAHLTVAGFWYGRCRWRARQGKDFRADLLAAVCTAFMGPFGSLGTACCLLLELQYRRRSRPFEEWYLSLFPDETLEAWEDIAAAVESVVRDDRASEARITPFADILSFGAFPDKQYLLALITRNFRPQFAPILRLAMNDPNNAIRVQAATAMTRVEDGFTAKLMALRSRIESGDMDVQLRYDLARHCDDYAFAGILDPEREAECRQTALRYYREYLTLAPGHPAACLAVGRLLVREGRHEESSRWFLENEPVVASLPGYAIWRVESLYYSRQFDAVRRMLEDGRVEQQARDQGLVEVADAFRLWRGEAA